MNIVVRGKHLRENQALEEYALKKTSKFYHYFPEIIKTEVELKSESGHKGKEMDFLVDILVKVPGKTFKVSDSERDMYKAIDKAVERMSETLRREKDRKKSRTARSLRHFTPRDFDFLAPFRAVNKRLFRR
jgi:ribosomal subunit interface protein